LRLCGDNSEAKRDLAIYSAPEDENKGARERKEVTMYKRLIRLYKPEQKRVYPRDIYYNIPAIKVFTDRANPHYP